MNDFKSTHCPFRVGQLVRYSPSDRGYGEDVMFDGRLKIGGIYSIVEIQDKDYVLVEGYNHPGGGLYWSEFQEVPDDSEDYK